MYKKGYPIVAQDNLHYYSIMQLHSYNLCTRKLHQYNDLHILDYNKLFHQPLLCSHQ